MRNFNLHLDKVLSQLVLETMPGQTPVGGQDMLKQDALLQQKQKDAERQLQNKTGQSPDMQKNADQKVNQKLAMQQQKDQAEKQQQEKKGAQLSTQMAGFDKDISQLQAKIQGGAIKPADVNKLNQQLKAKDAIQKQFMTNYGVTAP